MGMAEAEAGSTVTPSVPTCDSTAHCSSPSFVKTIRIRNMRCGRLELPTKFVKDHGHGFQKTVILQGPGGRMKSVHLGIQSHGQDRVYFRGAEWRAFLLENEFKVGHQLHFSLVSMSTFTVRLSENPASSAPADKHSLSLKQHNIPNSSFKYPSETRSSTRPSGNVKNDVIYMSGTLKYEREVEALLENLQCPHFVTVIKQSNVHDCRSSALSVPMKFLEKYGMYFSEVHDLQGPSGSTVEVRFSSRAKKGARFTTGWKAFRKENGIRLGDVLLFSLREPACWLVQLVGNSRSEELGIEEPCNLSDLD